MATQDPRSLENITQALVKVLLIALLVAGLLGIAVAVALSPMLVASAYGVDDWGRIGDIGQAYDAASAMLAVVALAVISASLLMQRAQYRHTQRALLRERSREITRMAVDDPQLAQCWGAGFAPAHIDETLFFYTNMIVQQWSYAWEDRLLTEAQARDYLRQFFDSEVPRMFWERHSDWHQPRRTLTRADRFIALMDREYLCALKGGPPTRAYEPRTFLIAEQPRRCGSGAWVESSDPDLADEVSPSGDVKSDRGRGSLRVADAD